MKWIARAAALAIAFAMAFWIWRTFFPSPEALIRKRLNSLAACASFTQGQSDLSKMIGAQRVPGFFAPDVNVIIDVPAGRLRHSFADRDEIARAALGTRQQPSLSVKFPDINVTVNPDGRTAMADATVIARVGGERDDIVQELQISFVLSNGDWLITGIQSAGPVSLH